MIFDRRSRTLLTADGRGLMADFSEMLNLRSNIIGRVQPAGLYSGFFRLGVTEMVALTWLPELIAAIKQRYPKIVLQSKVDRTRNLWQQLNTNQLDLIICPWAGEKDNMLDNAFLDSTDYAWMIHRSLLCPDKAIYSFEEIMQFPLVTHSEDSMLHGLLARLSSEKKMEPKDKIFCGSLIAIAELAKGSLGVACLPRSYFGRYIEDDSLAIIQTDFPSPSVEYFAVYRSGRITDDVADMARNHCDFAGRKAVPHILSPKEAPAPTLPPTAHSKDSSNDGSLQQ
jgi:DNA-binding transcriptional LysR family regulator